MVSACLARLTAPALGWLRLALQAALAFWCSRYSVGFGQLGLQNGAHASSVSRPGAPYRSFGHNA